MADLTIPQGNYGYYLNFTVNDSGGDAYDLDGYTITLKVWGGTGVLVDEECDIVVAGSGTCKYLIASGDFDRRGIYKAELELTKEGVVESTINFTIEVAESN